MDFHQCKKSLNRSKSFKKLAINRLMNASKKNIVKTGKKSSNEEIIQVEACINFSLQCGMKELRLIMNTFSCTNL